MQAFICLTASYYAKRHWQSGDMSLLVVYQLLKYNVVTVNLAVA
jgi:hypothetical protein